MAHGQGPGPGSGRRGARATSVQEDQPELVLNKMSRPLDFDPISEASRQWSAHGWDEASEGMAAITSVVRAQQLFLGRIDTVLRPLGLTFARYEVLMLLLFSRRGALPLNKIGARLQVHPTSVTNAVDRLEEQGLIKRVPHSSDRRTTLAEILPGGRELALRATAALNGEVFSEPGMSQEDLRLLVGVLQRFRQAAGDFAETTGPTGPTAPTGPTGPTGPIAPTGPTAPTGQAGPPSVADAPPYGSQSPSDQSQSQGNGVPGPAAAAE